MKYQDAVDAARRAREPKDIFELAVIVEEIQDRRRSAPPPARVDSRLVRTARRRKQTGRRRPPQIRVDRKELKALAAASAELAKQNDEAIAPAGLHCSQPPGLSTPPRQPWRHG